MTRRSRHAGGRAVLIAAWLFFAVARGAGLGALDTTPAGLPAEEAGTRSVVAVFSPQETTVGEPLVVWVRGRGSSAELRSPAGRTVSASTGLPVGVAGGVVADWHLLAVGPTLAPGVYRLIVTGEGGQEIYTDELTVLPGDFRTETIALDAVLTGLRTTEDPRRASEAVELSSLLSSRDPMARYHTGQFAWPLPPDTRRTSLFGDRRTFTYADGTSAESVHVGLDLAAPTGTPVHSSGSGIVRMARYRIMTGYTVVIEHLPGLYSLYYHLDELSISEGDLVTTGDQVGTVGATGLATGPHLHWEFRVGGVAVSPASMTERDLLRPQAAVP